MGRPVLALPDEIEQELRRLHELPEQDLLNAYLSLLAERGWGYQPAATVLGMHRQSVRQRAQQGDQRALKGAALPTVPEARPGPPKPPAITPAEEERLLDLKKRSEGLRAEHPADDPRRLATEQMTKLIDQLTKRKITYAQIAKVLGVRPMTVRARLMRHGYRNGYASLPLYRGKRPTNRAKQPA